MARFYADRVAVFTPTTGTGNITPGDEIGESFRSVSESGIENGDNPFLQIQEGDDFEICDATYVSGGPHFTRDTVLVSKIAGTVGTSKMNLAGAAVVRFVMPSELWNEIAKLADIREKLTANRTYFVATTGDDGNDGLDSGSPFATIQHAIDVVYQTLDLGDFTVTIQLADGTYAESIVLIGPYLGSWTNQDVEGSAALVTIQGNDTNPENVIVAGDGTTKATFMLKQGAAINLKAFEIRNTAATTGRGLWLRDMSTAYIQTGMRFGTCSGEHMQAHGGVIRLVGNYSIVGNASKHMFAEANGNIHGAANITTVTLTGTPAFGTSGENGFAVAKQGGAIRINSSNITYSGSGTGRRFYLTRGGIIDSGSTTYFPGDADGVNDGGFYNNVLRAAEVYDNNLRVVTTAATINTQTSSYTVVLTDEGRVVEMDVGSANNLTIPPNSSVSFPVGTWINVTQLGAGQTTLVQGAGVTIRNRNGLKLAGQYAVASLYKRGTDEWVVGGDLAV